MELPFPLTPISRFLPNFIFLAERLWLELRTWYEWADWLSNWTRSKFVFLDLASWKDFFFVDFERLGDRPDLETDRDLSWDLERERLVLSSHFGITRLIFISIEFGLFLRRLDLEVLIAAVDFVLLLERDVCECLREFSLSYYRSWSCSFQALSSAISWMRSLKPHTSSSKPKASEPNLGLTEASEVCSCHFSSSRLAFVSFLDSGLKVSWTSRFTFYIFARTFIRYLSVSKAAISFGVLN